MDDAGMINYSYSPSIGWLLVLLFGFFGIWIGASIANRVTNTLPKSAHTATYFMFMGGFSLLGGVIGGLLFIP